MRKREPGPTGPLFPAAPAAPAAPAPDPVEGEGWSYRADRLRLRHLRLLSLIDAGGSLGSAARRLGLSQPATTLLLREIETVFGAALVVRDRRGARLTVAGRQALDRLTVALSAVERAIRAAREPAAEPPLRIGCVQMAGIGGLPAALDRLDRAGALGRIALREGRTGDLLAGLREGSLDCVIGWIDESVVAGLPMGELRIEPLWYGRMQVVAARSHPLDGARGLTAAELARWPWIVPPPGSRTHAAFLRLFLRDGIAAPPVAVECAALHTMLQTVSASRLLAVAPDAAVRHYARLGLVTALRGARLSLGRNQVAAVTRRDSDPMPAMRALRRALLAGSEGSGAHAPGAGAAGASAAWVEPGLTEGRPLSSLR